jgi:hypothetical protein
MIFPMKKVDYHFIYLSIYCRILVRIVQNTPASHRGNKSEGCLIERSGTESLNGGVT